MKLINKYILLSIFKSSFSTLFALVFIFAFFQFIDELDEIGEKKYTLEVAIKYILLLLPSILNSLVVLSLLIGTVFSLGKLNSNKELQIFHTASISQRTLIGKTLIYPFLISIILFTSLEFITPQTLMFANQVKDDALGKNSYQETNEAWFKKNNDIIFLSKAKNSKYYLKLFNIKDNDLLSYTQGTEAFFSGNQLVTNDSNKIEFKNNGKYVIPINSYSDSNLKVNLDFEEVASLTKNVKTMSFFELLKIITPAHHSQSNRNEIILEIFSRVIRPYFDWNDSISYTLYFKY